MGKILPKRLLRVYDDFDFSRDDNFVGKEFKQIFPSSLPSVVRDIRIIFNDANLSNVLVRGIIKRFADDTEQIVFEEYGNGFYNRSDKEITLGAGEYFGIQTTTLETGTHPGAKAIIVTRAGRG